MTDYEASLELERLVKEQFPLIASQFIDREVMLEAAKKISHEVTEWRGVGFPYKELNEEFLGLIQLQYARKYDHNFIGADKEKEIVSFLNNYYRWALYERSGQAKELENNSFELSEQDKRDFDRFRKELPTPWADPLDVEGYLHMCRIAYDAAPKYVYPSFVSDLYVVTAAKWDDCGITYEMMHDRMRIGDRVPRFMWYHPDEMGFGGPWVEFVWDNRGWIMRFKSDRIEEAENKDIHRFLAIRRAGYPVKYCNIDT